MTALGHYRPIFEKPIQRVYELHYAFYNATISKALELNQLMIDLGGRFNHPADFKSVDLKDADIIADLNGLYPFEDSTVGVVRAYDFLEHVEDKMHSLSEIHRILIPGGVFLSSTPSTVGPDGLAGMGSDQDPTHVSHWNRNSFWYVTDPEKMKYIDNKTVRFESVILENVYPTDWHRENRIPYVIFDGIKR